MTGPARWRGLLAEVRARPRHLALAAFAAGLLTHAHAGVVLVCGGALVAVAGRAILAALAALALLAGALAAQERLRALDRTALAPAGRTTLHGALAEAPRRFPDGSVEAVVALSSVPGAGEKVAVRASGAAFPRALSPGAIVQATGRLSAVRRDDSHRRRRGIHAVLQAWHVDATGRRRAGLSGAMDVIRREAERSVTRGLDPRVAPLALGMVLGRDERLAASMRDDFREAGLAHLLAASGQNVMLLAALAVGVLSALGAGLRGRLAGALALIALYVPLAGAGPSIQRAGVMGAAAIVAALAGRPGARWYALLLAAAVTLTANPRAVGDPGWQLSFAAVAGIALLARRWGIALAQRGVPSGLAEAAAVTLAATLATAPLLAFHFERVSLVSLPANVLAVPVVAPVMWLGMLAAALGWLVPALADVLNALAQPLLAYLAWLAAAAAALPGAEVGVRIASPLRLAGAYGALALALAPGPWRWLRARPRLALAVAALALVVAVVATRPPPPPDPRAVVVSFLDVGQGDATLIQHAGATVLVDTGPPGSALLERLRQAGVRRVDVLVVTHAQADHDGGADGVLRRHEVGLLLDGGDGADTPQQRRILATARARRVQRVTARAGQHLQAGPMDLRLLWPPAEPAADHAGEDPNLRAVVMHVRIGQLDVLLPADAESEVTEKLDLPAAEVLKVAHHGSEDLGLARLVARLRPRLAVIEVGRGNTYGHPTAQALRALRGVPRVHRTDRDGTVRLTVSGGRMTVATARRAASTSAVAPDRAAR